MIAVQNSVTGFWGGVYFYPDDIAEPVNFDAELLQSGDTVSGSLTESNTIDPEGGVLLASVIDGKIAGRDISFLKRYTHGTEKHDVQYTGVVSPDFKEISGRWSILTYSGSFVMTRDNGKSIEASQSRAHIRSKEFVQ